MNIKLLPTIAVFLLITPVQPIFSNQLPSAVSAIEAHKALSSEADIMEIRKECTRINSIIFKPMRFKFESAGCIEDGVIAYFQNNNRILKITNTGSIGDGSWATEFYYSAGKLIFCYDKMIGGAAAEEMVTTEYRLYMKDGKPIKCIEGKKIIQPDSRTSDYIKTADKIFKAYKTRNFIAALCDA